jgi:DNA-binding XRE family transcriptional regulator
LEVGDTHIEEIKDYCLKLGDKIMQVRKERSYSQEQLSDMMNINRSTIFKIENGKFSITVYHLVPLSIFWIMNLKLLKGR